MHNWTPGLQRTSQPGWLAEERITALPQVSFCPAALTRIYRQQRRHLGCAPTEPCAVRKPQKRVRLPGATPEQKGTTQSPPNYTLDRPRRTTIRKSALARLRQFSPGFIPIQIRRGQPVQRREVLDLTLIVQCTLGLVVSNDGLS